MSDSVREISINGLAAGGDGVGTVDGKVCFVPMTAAGDTVAIRITSRHPRYLRAVPLEILVPSPLRCEPLCPHFGCCGGCLWQHIDDAGQVRAKEDILSNALRHPGIRVAPSPTSYAYRAVARLHVRTGPGGSPKALGFHHVSGSDIVPIDTCPVLLPELSDALARIRGEVLRHLPETAEVRLVHGDDGTVMVITSDTYGSPELYEATRRLVPHSLAGVEISTWGMHLTVAGKTDIGVSSLDGGPFTAPAASFGQANRPVSLAMADTLRRWVVKTGVRSLLELFGGAGNFSVGLVDLLDRLTVSDLDAAAVAHARRNLAKRVGARQTVVQGDALTVYHANASGHEAVLLDPPRKGHLALARAIAAKNHAAVMYVSCNPSTLARDLAPLLSAGYNCTAACGFDMFPQTPHMEAAVLLER